MASRMRRMSIAPASRIVQNCKESSDFCTIDCSGATNGGFLTARGFPTGYYYTTKDSTFTIYKYGESLSSSREIYKNNYGSGTMVVSASYFRLNESSETVLILVRQAKTSTSGDFTFINCVSLKTKRLIKSCVFSGKYNKMEVCIDGRQIEELSKMKEGLRSLENIIVVGGDESSACLVSLGSIFETDAKVTPTAPTKRIQLIRPDDNGMLEYRGETGYSTFDPKRGRVESLCYMSQRSSIAIGMNMGAIFFVSLKTGRTDSLSLGACVERMVVQHPLNDSDNSLFLWAQVQHHNSTHLVLMSTLPNDSSSTNELLFIPRFFYAPPQCVEFLQFRSVVLNRQQATMLGNSDDANDDESSRDSNSSFVIRESARFNQLMLFLYTERSNNGFVLRGSVFDLDGYYSRRMPREALPDRTPAQQCGFLSHFHASKMSFDPSDTIDFLLADVGRFVPSGSLGTIDQHFYPSSLYFTFHLLSDEKAVEMRVPCLQDQIVNDVSNNFLDYYRSPTQITQFLHGIGLCNSLADSNESVMRTCLLRVLLHNYFPGCMNFLRNEEVDVEMLHFVHKWLGKEVEITKTRFDEESKTLFEMRPSDLPRPAVLFANHSQLVFRRASQLYDILMERFQYMNANQDVIHRLKINKKICEDLLLQISAILFGSHVDLLRETPENVERLNKVRLGFAERRSIALRLGIRLEIYKIFDDIIEASREIEHYKDIFGRRLPHELYPPDSFTDLLDVLPHFSVTLSAKLQILGYFVRDLDHFAPITGQKQSTFDIAGGFLLNDNLTSEAMSEMLTAWNSDMRLLRINQMREVPGMEALKRLSDVNEKPYSEQDLKFMQCNSKEERDKLLKLYERFRNGIHKFNLDMISRRRFELIVDPPAQILPNEPSEVVHARNEVARIKRDYSHLFVRNSFNQAILDKCREQQNRPPHMVIAPLSNGPLQIQLDCNSSTNFAYTKGTVNATIVEEDNETDSRFEAFPPRTPVANLTASRNQSMIGADQMQSTPPSHLNSFGNFLPRLTPPSQSSTNTPINNLPPPSPYISHDASKLIQGSAMKRKEMERLQRLTTPQSVRIRRERVTTNQSSSVSRKRRVFDQEDNLTSTPPNANAEVKAPTSILRDNSNKRPRISEEPRSIKFFEKQRVITIPSNHENREMQQAETSFTDFVALNDSSTDELMLGSKTFEVEEDFVPMLASTSPSSNSIIVEEEMTIQSEEIEEITVEPSPVKESSNLSIENGLIASEESPTKRKISPRKSVSPIKPIEVEKESSDIVQLIETEKIVEIIVDSENSSTKEVIIEREKHVEAIENGSHINEVTSQSIEEAPKKRGRPRKSLTPKKSEIEEESPKRRGRPPTPKSAIEEDEAPKRRGRPRKSPSVSVTTPKKEAMQEETIVDEQPKKRGRPPKLLTTASSELTLSRANTRDKTPNPDSDDVEDAWLRRNLRVTPERRRRVDRKK